MPKLVVRQGTNSRELLLTREGFTIGRTPENNLEVNSPLVSRRHASIVFEDDRYVVRDLGSSNGTYVNRARIDCKPLEHGDVLRVGDADIQFVDEAHRASPADLLPWLDDLRDHSQLIASVNEVARRFNIETTSASSTGLSLRELREELTQEKTAKDSKMFFILFQVGKALGTAATLDEMFLTATQLIFDVINAERSVMLIGRDGSAVRPLLAYHRGGGGTDAATIPFSQTIVSQAMNEKVSVSASDALRDPRFVQGHSIALHNIRSVLCVPLWEENEVHGAIYLDNAAQSYAFTQDDLELLTAIANLIAIRMTQEETHARLRREELARANLAKFHSPDVVDMIMAHGGEVGLEVTEREVSVVFIDVESSTRMAETLAPKDIAGLLNEFFLMATNAVFAHHGHVNKFIGDEVMAIYNAPLALADHPEAAVRTCITLLEELERFNATHPERAFNVRCSVNTGVAVVGNVGTPLRMEYTVLGDTVNVAARLSKLPGVNTVVVGEHTYERVQGAFQARDLGAVALRGREQPLRAYEILR